VNEVKIGWAMRDVSTTEPVNIPGQFHMRISQGIVDPVTVCALVVDNGEDCAIFLSADIVIIRSRLLDKIRARVAALDPAIPVLKILMNATHTHTGPTTCSGRRRSGWRATGTCASTEPSTTACRSRRSAGQIRRSAALAFGRRRMSGRPVASADAGGRRSGLQRIWGGGLRHRGFPERAAQG